MKRNENKRTLIQTLGEKKKQTKTKNNEELQGDFSKWDPLFNPIQ